MSYIWLPAVIIAAVFVMKCMVDMFAMSGSAEYSYRYPRWMKFTGGFGWGAVVIYVVWSVASFGHAIANGH